MRLLANENVPGLAVEALRAQAHDVSWIRSVAPGSSDRDVLARAITVDRILLTFDKDFGELAFRAGLPASSGIVLFRVALRSAAQVAAYVSAALESRSDWAGHFSVIEQGRVRMRPLPSNGNLPNRSSD